MHGPAADGADPRAVVAWSAAALFVVLSTGNPAYRALVLAAALAVVLSSAGLARARRLLAWSGMLGLSAVLLWFVLTHAGSTVLFAVPDSVPAIGGPYTLESLAFGAVSGVTLAAAVLAVAPVSLLLEPHEMVDALPAALARSGSAVAAALNLVPTVAASFTAVTEAQRLRGWRPRGPASWAEIVVPVVLTAIEDSIQLAESMEARAFGSGPRTHLRRRRVARPDRLVLATAAAAVAAFLAARLAGWEADWYPYPFLHWPDVSALPAAPFVVPAGMDD